MNTMCRSTGLFMAALLSTCACWHVHTNIEAGNGRTDIAIEKDDGTLGIILELKAVQKTEELDAACEKAMEQIAAKDYAYIFRDAGIDTIWTYGIVFCRKACKVLAKRV